MGLIQKEVKTVVSTYNLEHFLSLGYKCKNGDKIIVKVEDLPRGSGIKIKVQCDYCGKEFFQAFRRFMEHPEKVCCLDCRPKKFGETNLKKFGCTCSLHNSEIHAKVIKTWKTKYGADNPWQTREIREKIKNTMLKKYGVISPIHKKEFVEKMNKTMKNNSKGGFIYTSVEQKRICEFYGGEINYQIENFFVDIFLPKYNICCEYDGGGHNLSVIHKHITQEELDKKDMLRNLRLVELGYKVLRIVQKSYKTIPEELLKNIYQKAIKYLINQNNNIYIYEIDTGIEKIL